MKTYKSDYEYKAGTFVVTKELVDLVDEVEPWDDNDWKDCVLRICNYGFNGICEESGNEKIDRILEKTIPIVEKVRRRYYKKLQRTNSIILS